MTKMTWLDWAYACVTCFPLLFTGAACGGKALSNLGGDASGPDAGSSCANRTVTFKLIAPNGSPPGTYCGPCGQSWLTIIDARTSQPLVLDHGCGATECNRCTPGLCLPLACLNLPLTSEGVTWQWDGSEWLDSTCGTNPTPCSSPHCVQPGKYIAQMCTTKSQPAANSSTCIPGDSPICTQVSFALPDSTLVTGTIGN
jgi:hypothetical protein